MLDALLLQPFYLGVLKNVPTDVILRPQRGTDVMIVMDFNGYAADDDFNWEVSLNIIVICEKGPAPAPPGLFFMPSSMSS